MQLRFYYTYNSVFEALLLSLPPLLMQRGLKPVKKREEIADLRECDCFQNCCGKKHGHRRHASDGSSVESNLNLLSKRLKNGYRASLSLMRCKVAGLSERKIRHMKVAIVRLCR